jgi:hypothetical protein
MTKARQRERKRRMQRAAASQRISAAADERETDEAMVKIVDVVFRGMAEKAAAENDISIEDAIEGSWTLFDRTAVKVALRTAKAEGLIKVEQGHRYNTITMVSAKWKASPDHYGDAPPDRPR